jgi:hypothetical protein
MFLLGPDVRFGYFLYPLGLLGWLALTNTTSSGPQEPETLAQDIVQDR